MSRTPLARAPRLRRNAAEMADLKRDMLTRARQIYRDEGVEALSMRRLAQELGLSTMAIYSYFPSKQALLDGMWIEVFEALVEQLLRVSQGLRSPRKVLEAHVRGFLDFWEQRPEQFRMIYMSLAHAAGLDQVGEEQRPVYGRLLGLIRERVAASVQGGEPDEATLGLLCDLMSVKSMGYLLLVLGLPRYPLQDREALRERVVQEVLRDVSEALRPAR